MAFTAGPAWSDALTAMDAYERGDYAAALREAGPLAKGGDPMAQYLLGHLYFNGHGVVRNQGIAESMLRQSALKGFASAQLDLTKLLLRKPGNADNHRREARIWAERAARQSLTEAQYLVATMYYRGIGGDADMAAAAQWYREAAKTGDPRADYALGLLARSGPEEKPNWDVVQRHFQSAADGGLRNANHALGMLFLDGRGAQPDPVKAIGFFLIAANADFAPSQRVLGQMYRAGVGVKKDNERAFLWLLKAAEGGDAIAQYELGQIFAAAELDQPKDQARAHAWYAIAASLGHPEAVIDRDRLAAQMSKVEMSASKKLVRSWK